MTADLAIVDTPGSAVLFGFQDTAGTQNPFGVQIQMARDDELNLGTFAPEYLVSDSISDGGQIIRQRQPLMQVEFDMKVKHTTSLQSAKDALHYLGQLLSQGGRYLKFTPTAGATTLYIPFESSPPLQAFSGQPLELLFAQQTPVVLPDITVRINRQPWSEEIELDPALNKATNPTLLYDFGGTANRPDGWTGDATWGTGLSAESIDATEQAYTFTKADGAAANLQQTTAVASFASGDVATFAFEAKVSAVAGTPQMQATLQFKQSDGTTNVGSLFSGGLVTLTTAWQTIKVTTTAAGALTSRAVVSIQVDNGDATSVKMFVRKAQPQVGSTPSTFRVPAEQVFADPASTAQPRRMVVFQPGDASARARVRVTADAQTVQRVSVYRESLDPVSYLKATLHKQAESGTLSNNTTAVADANASGGGGTPTAETAFALLSPTFRADSTASGSTTSGGVFTVTKPAGTAEFDLLVCSGYIPAIVANPVGSLPEGWKILTTAERNSVQDVTLAVFYKIAGPSEPASYSFQMGSGTNHYRAWMGAFSNVDRKAPLDQFSTAISSASGTSLALTAITTSRNNALILAIGAATSSAAAVTFTVPGGADPTYTEEDDGNTGTTSEAMTVDRGVLATAGTTTSDTITISTSAEWAGALIAFNASPQPLLERVRTTWTAIPAGTYDCWLRCYVLNAARARLEGQWALQASPANWNIMPDYIVDADAASTFEYVLVNLGRLQVPEEWTLDTLTLAVFEGLEEYVSTNFRVDWIDLIPANEFMAQMESTAVVASGEFLNADGKLPKVFHLDTGAKLKPLGKATNIPVMLEPGFNLLTILIEQEQNTGWNEHKAKLTAGPTVTVYTTPFHRT